MLHLKIIIVGGGTAGLAAAVTLRDLGHDVTVLERHPTYQPLGGPVTLTPGSTRIFQAHGMRERFETIASGKGAYVVRNFRYDGTMLSEGTDDVREKLYGFPTLILSRFRLQENLGQVGVDRGVKILFNSQVESVDTEKPAVHLKDGTTMEADLIVGADGYRSAVRTAVLDGKQIDPQTSCTAYNLNIDRSLLAKDPELAPLLNGSSIYLGHLQCIVCQNMADHNDKYNMTMLCENEKGKGEGEAGNWHQHANIEAVKKRYEKFDPLMQKLLNIADPKECYLWKLSQVPPIERWVSKSGKVVLIGDAAHGMLPFAGAGASMALEDAESLAICLARAETPEDVPKVLRAFEAIRKPRCEYFVDRANNIKDIWLCDDGPMQEQRDAFYRSRMYGMVNKDEWDGKHIDDPPLGNLNPHHYPYSLAYNIIDYSNRRLDVLLA